jgi:hypothetical protein
MVNVLLWGFNEWPRKGDNLRNGYFSKTKQLRRVKSFSNLMILGEIIQFFVFEQLNRLISEQY